MFSFAVFAILIFLYSLLAIAILWHRSYCPGCSLLAGNAKKGANTRLWKSAFNFRNSEAVLRFQTFVYTSCPITMAKNEQFSKHFPGQHVLFSGLGIRSFDFRAIRSFFVQKWAIRSHRSFPRSNLSESLMVAHFWWAKWANHSCRSFDLSEMSVSLTSLTKKEEMSENEQLAHFFANFF